MNGNVKNEMRISDRNRSSLVKALVLLIMVFSLTTLLQALFDKFSMNRIIGAVIVVLAGCLFMMKPTKKSFLCVALLVIDAIFSFFVTIDYSKELNDWIFLFATILLLCDISNSTNLYLFKYYFLKYIRIVRFLVCLESIVILGLLVTKTGYTYHWGEGHYFVGLCNSQHTMASLCCLIIAMAMLVVKSTDRNYIMYGILILIPTYSVLETGARVFMIPLAIMLFLFVQYGFKKRLHRALIYIIGLALGTYAALHSNMLDKFSFVINNIYAVNALSSFTSGRSEFWAADIRYFLSGNIIQRMIGTSFADVYAVNLREVNLEIWSHNDILHMLNGGGFLGVFCYVSLIFSTLKRARESLSSRFGYLLLVIYVVFPMLFNGFFTYQHFVYSFIILYLSMMIPKGVLQNENWIDNIS